jgi:hypothetical protein
MGTAENRRLMIALAGVLAVVFAFVFSNVAANHEPKPHNVPLALVGSQQAAEALTGRLEGSAPGAFEVRAYSSPEAARTAILHRKVYGAFEAGPPPRLLVASAASAAVARMLEETFRAATRTPGQPLAVRDVAPLPRSDSSGASAFSALLSLTIAGILGTSIIYLVTQHRPLEVRLAALVALAIGAGLMAALATNVVVGAFPRHFLAVWGVTALFVLAVSLPISAVQVVIGLPGTGVGFLAFVVVGTPSSGGASAPELLPGFWRVIGQQLPPGAGTTALRDFVYFHGHGVTHALTVLSTYAILGAGGALLAQRLRNRASRRTIVPLRFPRPSGRLRLGSRVNPLVSRGR